MPAWVFGLAALVGVGILGADLVDLVFGLIVTLAIGWPMSQTRSLAAGVDARTDSRLPVQVQELLVLIDGLIDQLERGQDEEFGRDLVELGIALNSLEPRARAFLEERGADSARLQHGVCTDAGLATTQRISSVERRRALHRDLFRFVASARGRPCGDPYRSRLVGGSLLLDALRDPALVRTRRIFVAAVIVLGGAWLGAWLSIAAWKHGEPVVLCNPFEVDSPCRLAFGPEDLAYGLFVVLALLPTYLLIAAALTRAAAWRSWAAALPESSATDLRDAGEGFVAMRQRLVKHRRVGRAVRAAWLVLGSVGLVVFFEPSLHGHSLGGVMMLAGLLALSLVVSPRLGAALERRGELRAFERRLARLEPAQRRCATELFAARIELADAVPPRAELLELLADTLADTEQLDTLAPADRDRVVDRLRAAASRGAALRREQRDRVLLDLETCEALLFGRSL